MRTKTAQPLHLINGFLACGLVGLLSLGCARTDPAEQFTCRVMIEGTLAHECHVTLLRIDSGRAVPVFEGSSTPDGTIILKPVDQSSLPNNELELVGLVESAGSAQWQLAAPWVNPLSTPLKVKWPPTDRPFEIKLPRKAIRSI